jgi:hypothetical protein
MSRSRGRVNTFHVESFNNQYDQEVKPGDKVVFAATSWKRTRLEPGVFDGVNKNQKGEVQSVRVSYPITKRVPNGKTEPTQHQRYNYQTKRYEDYIWERPLYDEVPGIGHSTLQLMRVFKI